MILVIGLTVLVTLAVVAAILFTLNTILEIKNWIIGKDRRFFSIDMYERQRELYEKEITNRDEIIRKLVEHCKRDWSNHSKNYIVENIDLTVKTLQNSKVSL
ncbi:MAG: hypothetical protein FWG63_02550 [Defluviitaleaceae bacterium]|nr:hypothetical protein [Defluviitaleaceae bacterium]